jgi:phage terminase small subunit
MTFSRGQNWVKSIMPKGQPPKPLALHKIDGTARKHRHGNLREPDAPGALTARMAPAWLTDDQRALWADVLADAPRDLLRRIDASLFANYIELMDRHAKAVVAQRALDHGAKLPFLANGKKGVMISPYIRIINHCVILMARLQSEMGFTPGAHRACGESCRPRGGGRGVEQALQFPRPAGR